jgi:outer membrane protein OmpA-like peptidoglycan-associated protein
MADLDVQPKRKRAWWPWLLLLLLVLLALFFFTRGCERNRRAATGPGAAATDSTAAADSMAALRGDTTDSDWNRVNFDAPAVSYEEIRDRDITVRGDTGYAIYGVEEAILFDPDKATLKGGAEDKLKQIAASMGQRFKNGSVRIYGYTDAKGSAGYNQQLAGERAETVRNWLIKNGNITEEQATVHPVGEARPVASNATAAGRSQNRRVEIVVRQVTRQ